MTTKLKKMNHVYCEPFYPSLTAKRGTYIFANMQPHYDKMEKTASEHYMLASSSTELILGVRTTREFWAE